MVPIFRVVLGVLIGLIGVLSLGWGCVMGLSKLELQEIKRCLKYMINGGTTPYSNLTMDINKKIQQMIDNHCEHDWVQTYTEREVCRCNKCDEESL